MDIKKLLEVAGVTAHLDEEKKVFAEVCAALKKLDAFCAKQNEDTYITMQKEASALCNKLNKHLERYK